MAAVLTDKKSNYVSRVVAGVEGLLASVDALNALRLEWDTLGLAPGSGTPLEIVQGDLTGANAHVTPQVLADAFASLGTLRDALLAGHLTNLNKLRR